MLYLAPLQVTRSHICRIRMEIVTTAHYMATVAIMGYQGRIAHMEDLALAHLSMQVSEQPRT